MSPSHIEGHTTPTARRAAEDFTASVHHLNLDEECERLIEEASSSPSRRSAKTLSKDGSMSVVLVAIMGGAEIKDHSAHGSALLHTLRGKVTISLEAGGLDLPAGQAVTLASQLRHRLTAEVNSVVLLAVAGDR